MSERSEIAQRLADIIVVNDLTNPYGGDVIKSGRHYTVLFSKPAVLDGAINVYGPKFIQINFQTQYRDLPNRASYVFESPGLAGMFLTEAFVHRNFAAALAVQRKS